MEITGDRKSGGLLGLAYPDPSKRRAWTAHSLTGEDDEAAHFTHSSVGIGISGVHMGVTPSNPGEQLIVVGDSVVTDGQMASLLVSLCGQLHKSEGGRVISQQGNDHAIGRMSCAGSCSKHAWGVRDHDLVGVSAINKGKYIR